MGKRLFEITPLDIEKFKTARSKQVSPASVNRELACFKHMFTKAIEWNMAVDNPVKKVRMFRENPGRIRYLTKPEAQQLLNECAEHLRPIVILALYTGMRLGEILNLKWENIDIRQKSIYIQTTKSGYSRDIPMAEPVYFALGRVPKISEYVFCKKDGTRIQDIRTAFNNAIKRAQIEDFRFHDLRHTFASHLVMNGADLMTVKELLGHRTISMTLRYAHLSPEHKRKAVESLGYLDGHNLDTRRDTKVANDT
jgi:integrase